MNLTDLQTFLEVVKTGSFTRAALDLGVPKSTVSRRVARLEERLGVELLVRKARSFTLSPDGVQLAERCAPALDEIAAAERSLEESRAEPTGLLRVTAAGDIGSSSAFVGMLVAYRERWPDVELMFELTSRRVDLVEEGFDVAIRAHPGPLPDSAILASRTLARDCAAVYAAPSYIERFGAPRNPQALTKHRCISLRVQGRSSGWMLRRRDADAFETYPVRDVVSANGFMLIGGMVAAGAGLGLLPHVVAAPWLRDGAIVSVLPKWEGPTSSLSLVWPLTRYPSPRVRSFIDHAVEYFADGGFFA